MRTAIHFGAALALLACLASGCRLFPGKQPFAQGHSPLHPAQPSPDSVAMEIIWARFPANDPVLDDAAWRDIDETQIEPAVRRELVNNGFRAGVISGSLPPAIAKVLHQGERLRTMLNRLPRPSRKAPTCSPSRSSVAANAECAAINAPKFRPRRSIHHCRS